MFDSEDIGRLRAEIAQAKTEGQVIDHLKNRIDMALMKESERHGLDKRKLEDKISEIEQKKETLNTANKEDSVLLKAIGMIQDLVQNPEQ